MNTESSSDEEIIFKVPASIPPEEAADLYVQEGWMASPDAVTVRKMLDKTFAVSAAFDKEGHLIGFMRALSDGCSDAYLLDLVVEKNYRKQGVGRRILENLSDYLKSLGVDWIVLIGAPGSEIFYSRTSVKLMEKHTPYRIQ